MQNVDAHPLGRPLLIVVCYNNRITAKQALRKIPKDRPYDVLVTDDGSTDETQRYLAQFHFPILRNEKNRGIGYSLKRAVGYARDHGYQVAAVMAGNNKDDPRQVPRLLAPIYDEGVDYVQGSRRLSKGKGIKTPPFRKLMIPLHAFLFKLMTGFPCTDALNGFRAYKISLFYEDREINVWQDWLDRYEFETYLHYKVLSRGYKVREVPVTKSYAHFGQRTACSHIRPIVDWWKIMRPLFYLALGLKK